MTCYKIKSSGKKTKKVPKIDGILSIPSDPGLTRLTVYRREDETRV